MKRVSTASWLIVWLVAGLCGVLTGGKLNAQRDEHDLLPDDEGKGVVIHTHVPGLSSDGDDHEPAIQRGPLG